MKFDCEKCGKIDFALMDGYPFGDRLLEGVMFIVILDDDHKASVKIAPDYADYFSQFNEAHWYPIAKRYAEKNDIFTCPTCGQDVVPDDMLG